MALISIPQTVLYKASDKTDFFPFLMHRASHASGFSQIFFFFWLTYYNRPGVELGGLGSQPGVLKNVGCESVIRGDGVAECNWG